MLLQHRVPATHLNQQHADDNPPGLDIVPMPYSCCSDDVKSSKDLMYKQLPLKGYMIRAFARGAAREYNATWFKASNRWLDEYKRKNKLGSRRVTKTRSRPMIENSQKIEDNRQRFIDEYKKLSRFFHRRLIGTSIRQVSSMNLATRERLPRKAHGTFFSELSA